MANGVRPATEIAEADHTLTSSFVASFLSQVKEFVLTHFDLLPLTLFDSSNEAFQQKMCDPLVLHATTQQIPFSVIQVQN
jgi:hypothetical protein